MTIDVVVNAGRSARLEDGTLIAQSGSTAAAKGRVVRFVAPWRWRNQPACKPAWAALQAGRC